MFDDCTECGCKYPFSAKTVVIYNYLWQAQHNHILTTCPRCGYQARIWYDADTYWYLLKLKPRPLVRNLLMMYGQAQMTMRSRKRISPATRELTAADEEVIAKFREAIEAA